MPQTATSLPGSLGAGLLTPRTAPDQAQARAAERFERVSVQLGESYRQLAARHSALTDELAALSAQRQAQLDEQARLANRVQHLLDVLPSGVVVLDEQGQVREANPAARGLLGEPLLGESWRQIIARSFAPRADDGHEVSLRDGRRLSIETRALDPEPGQLIVLNDLSETRRLQDQLAQHRRLSSLGRMVSALAHQLRTPLSAALLYAEHLADADAALPEATRLRFAGQLKERLHALEHQVRDMLVFARGELPLTDRLSPKALMRALQEAAQPLVEGHAVRWQCDVVGGELLCNRETLVGALLNALDNGIQASAKPARLKVHCYQRGDQMRLCISDAGTGVDAPTLARLGEPFFSTKATGTGLGLAVVKAVSQAHQGGLSLQSRLGRGTCVTVKLPLQQRSTASV